MLNETDKQLGDADKSIAHKVNIIPSKTNVYVLLVAGKGEVARVLSSHVPMYALRI